MQFVLRIAFDCQYFMSATPDIHQICPASVYAKFISKPDTTLLFSPYTCMNLTPNVYLLNQKFVDDTSGVLGISKSMALCFIFVC